jgi:hypothetical protein
VEARGRGSWREGDADTLRAGDENRRFRLHSQCRAHADRREIFPRRQIARRQRKRLFVGQGHYLRSHGKAVLAVEAERLDRLQLSAAVDDLELPRVVRGAVKLTSMWLIVRFLNSKTPPIECCREEQIKLET